MFPLLAFALLASFCLTAVGVPPTLTILAVPLGGLLLWIGANALVKIGPPLIFVVFCILLLLVRL